MQTKNKIERMYLYVCPYRIAALSVTLTVGLIVYSIQKESRGGGVVYCA